MVKEGSRERLWLKREVGRTPKINSATCTISEAEVEVRYESEREAVVNEKSERDVVAQRNARERGPEVVQVNAKSWLKREVR